MERKKYFLRRKLLLFFTRTYMKMVERSKDNQKANSKKPLMVLHKRKQQARESLMTGPLRSSYSKVCSSSTQFSQIIEWKPPVRFLYRFPIDPMWPYFFQDSCALYTLSCDLWAQNFAVMIANNRLNNDENTYYTGPHRTVLHSLVISLRFGRSGRVSHHIYIIWPGRTNSNE